MGEVMRWKATTHGRAHSVGGGSDGSSMRRVSKWRWWKKEEEEARAIWSSWAT
jgi:hypothetical protein